MSAPITGTGITVETGEGGRPLGPFYQLFNGHVERSKHLDRGWTNEQLPFSPVSSTPLTAITYNDGREIRIYYLDFDYHVQEYCYTEGKGWYSGQISQLNAKATAASGLAAVVYGADVLGAGEKGVRIRVYYQEVRSNLLVELAYDGCWHIGDMKITDAMGATKLAAVAYYFENQTQIRVYYQDRDLFLKEYRHNNNGWFQDPFNPRRTVARTPLSAIVFANAELQVYYRDLRGRMVFVKHTGFWSDPNVIQNLGPGHKFAVVQWENGARLRLYYQEFYGTIIEICSDNRGESWYPGELRVGR